MIMVRWVWVVASRQYFEFKEMKSLIMAIGQGLIHFGKVEGLSLVIQMV